MSCSARYFVNLPEKLDLEIYSGQSFPLPTTLADLITGEPFDLTDWVGLAEIRDQQSAALIETFIYTVEDPPTGALVLSLTIAQCTALANYEGAMVWDFKITKDGECIPIYYGDVLAERYHTEGAC